MEFRSAFWKKIRVGDLSEAIVSEVITCFENDMEHYYWITVNIHVIESAKTLIMRYGKKGLRTLDSLQLTSALTLKENNCIFMTADLLLKSLMSEEHLNTV